ncbi:MAG: Gfo/Idh/MocA family oxidoreductase [Verrucomicrobiota bacterium]
MSEIRFGIIGTGVIAEFHAAAIADAKGAVLTAVCDMNPERGQAFGEKHGVAYERDLNAFLAREDVDAVTIATPTGVHADVAVPAAKAGKHVLCEKPLDINVERVNKIIDACDENKVTLACVFQSRLSRNIQRIKAAIDEGRFGKLIFASAQIKWFRDQEYYDSGQWRGTWAMDGGGALMNQSIHTIDLLAYLAGRPKSVCANIGTLTHTGIEVEDTAVAAIQFECGAMGTIEASTSCAPGFPRRLEISGEKGSIVMEDDDLIRWSFADQTAEDEAILEEGRAGEDLKGGSSDPKAISHDGHRRLIEDMCEAIQTGREPMIPGREGLLAVELISGIYESAKTGQAYKF